MKYTLHHTSYFEKRYKRMPKRIRLLAEEKTETLMRNMHHPTLKTHKLTGKWSGCFAFSVNYAYRIIFQVRENKIILLNIGTHEIYN